MNSKIKNDQYQLLNKCLREVCCTYKIACIIELCVFLALMSIFIYFNLILINVNEFWKTNNNIKEKFIQNFDKKFDLYKHVPLIGQKLDNLFLNVCVLNVHFYFLNYNKIFYFFQDYEFFKENSISFNLTRLRLQKVKDHCAFSILDNYVAKVIPCYPIYSIDFEEKMHKYSS